MIEVFHLNSIEYIHTSVGSRVDVYLIPIKNYYTGLFFLDGTFQFIKEYHVRGEDAAICRVKEYMKHIEIVEE